MSLQKHSPHRSSRRRALFPCDENSVESDFSFMSPLRLDSNSEDEEPKVSQGNNAYSLNKNCNEYDIIGIVNDGIFPQTLEISTPQNKSCSTTVMLAKPSPNCSDFLNNSLHSLETTYSSQFDESPTKQQKTPHDLPDNSKLPKLSRKGTLSVSYSDNDLSDSSISQILTDSSKNLNGKNPKIRTALFPEVDYKSVPPHNFYLKSETYPTTKLLNARRMNSSTSSSKKKSSHVAARKRKPQYGQINAGVKHSIRRTKKPKTITKYVISRVGRNMLNISSQNEPQQESQIEPTIDNSSQTRPELKSQTDECTTEQQFLNSNMDGNMSLFKQAECTNFTYTNQSMKETEDIGMKPSHLSNDSVLLHQPNTPDVEEEVDPRKKFFKRSRHKGVVALNGNLKVHVTNGKISSICNNANLKRTQIDQNNESAAKRLKLTEFETDFNTDNNELLIPPTQVSDLIKLLDDKENVSNETTSQSQNDLLLSPTSQMCDMTSGLAINTPKKLRSFGSTEEKYEPVKNEKLFPIFYPGNIAVSTKRKHTSTTTSDIHVTKKLKKVSKDQMLLDAGQKKFGATQCFTCGIIYHIGDPTDEIMHQKYHNAQHIFHFNGWKNERVVASRSQNEKVLQILPTDSSLWWKKLKIVVEIVNRDLGYFDIPFNTEHSQVFLYIKQRKIVGVLIAENISEGHKLLTKHTDQVDMCSEEAYPVKCGVSRIWVSEQCRHTGIATSLMNSLKQHFIMGETLQNEDIALSSPTAMGKLFGANYFKTPHFLIYYV